MPIGDLTSSSPGSAARFNDGKSDYSLIPIAALSDCARVFQYGAKKYSRDNWMKGMAWSIPLGCILRHLAAWQAGEDVDAESGLSHLGHIHCNLVMLSTYARTFPEGDDRAKKWLSSLTRAAAAEVVVGDEGIAPDSPDAFVEALLPAHSKPGED